ncbi:MAG: glycosyltransferase family 10, partial [Bauldia sp.]
PLVLFQSAPIDRGGRYACAAALMRHVRTDSYGRMFNNRTLAGPDLGQATKRTMLSRYKFTLAIENSIAPDYVTEKFFDPLLAGSVPVYRGAPNVRDFSPGPKSYIDASDFGSPRDLARYLNDLAGDETAYAAYFAWRDNPEKAFLDKVAAIDEAQIARLGRAVRERVERRGVMRPRTIYPFSPARRLFRSLARFSPT